jgi:hypothetical protein
MDGVLILAGLALAACAYSMARLAKAESKRVGLWPAAWRWGMVAGAGYLGVRVILAGLGVH